MLYRINFDICASWTISKQTKKSIYGRQMWFYIRMLEITLTAKIGILNNCEKAKTHQGQIITNIRSRQPTFWLHYERARIWAENINGKKEREVNMIAFLYGLEKYLHHMSWYSAEECEMCRSMITHISWQSALVWRWWWHQRPNKPMVWKITATGKWTQSILLARNPLTTS